MKRPNLPLSQRGFTLIELLVAMAITGIVMGAILSTLKSQQDSYVTQEKVTMMHQNLRASMHMIMGEIQMGGFYTSLDTNIYTMDWDPTNAGNENMQPTTWGRNDDAAAGNNVRDGTDLIVIVKAGSLINNLASGVTVAAGTNQLTLSALDLDGDTTIDFNTTTRKYGLLIRADLAGAEFFEVATTADPATMVNNFNESYAEGDMIVPVDVIIYRVNDNNATFGGSVIERRNLGNDCAALDNTCFRVVAENISGMQFSYHLSNGTWVDAGAATWTQDDIREIQVTLTSVVAISPAAGAKTRTLTSTIKIRNQGL